MYERRNNLIRSFDINQYFEHTNESDKSI